MEPLKIARLVAIVVILLNKRMVTAGELAERFEVSTRTIYRDIETLSSAGIPVYATQGKSGGIALMDDYHLDRTLITNAESESLLFALKTLQAVRYPEVELIFDKLGALFSDRSAVDWVEVEFSPWGRGQAEEEKFNTIRRAILGREVLKFDYVDSSGKRSGRVVEPMKLRFKGAAWYLLAWCRTRKASRTFRISRIREPVAEGETFTRREYSPPMEGTESKSRKKPVQLKLKFHPRVAYRVYDDFDDTQIRKDKNGYLEVEVQFLEDEWVYGYLLSFGPHVEVLEPGHIGKILRKKMETALKKY